MASQSPNETSRHGTFLRAAMLILLLVFVSIGVWFFGNASGSAKEILAEAEAAFANGEFEQAERLARNASATDPELSEAYLVLGQTLSQQQRYQEAITALEQIPEGKNRLSHESLLKAGQLYLMELKQPGQAERCYREVLSHFPDDVLANYRLAYILGLSGQTQAAIPPRLKLIELGQIEPVLLYLLCTGSNSLENVEQVKEYAEASPQDELVQLALATQAMNEADFLRAQDLLTGILQSRPDCLRARIMQGQSFLDAGQTEQFLNWQRSLKKIDEEDASLWVLQASWAVQTSQPEAATRCYWEAVKQDACHHEAIYQLGRLLQDAGRTETANIFLTRAKQLQEYYSLVKDVYMTPGQEAVQQTVQLAEQLGLIHEAYGWAFLVAKHYPGSFWAEEIVQRLQSKFTGAANTRVAAALNPANDVDLSDLPLPRFVQIANLNHSVAGNVSASGSQIRFENQARAAGLDFQFFNGAPRAKQTRRMYEFTGGGVAAFDYDGDRRPDLWLTQGNHQFNPAENTSLSDSLCRNVGGESFIDVTANARAAETGFSTGVTAADFDNDGFTDLFVCNIGANRFFHNNGDGTFEEITVAAGIAGEGWSTSCLFTDLNNNGLPDLYVVNYLQGEDLYDRICYDENGHPHSCIPANFAGQDDQLFQNNGDGTFTNITNRSGLLAAGKGLGIVAGDFDESGTIDLFIANDAEPNFYYNNATNGQEIELVEQALATGLAFNGSGASEACMGIATGDVNQDGTLDLFVTNFFQESNTLYLNSPPGNFQDQTREKGLREGSLRMLGFGTQLLDANLDGFLDLMLTNGHVDDLTDHDQPYQMPTQFYAGAADGQFAVLNAETTGPYFGEEHLGRGMASLDWNGDGLPDIAISNLDAPVALLTNRTESSGHFVCLELRGVHSTRDAGGTVVRINAGEQEIVRHLVDGSGYQASNERKLTIGIGSSQTLESLHIRWPSGQEQEFRSVVADREYMVIESRERLVEIPR